VRLRQQRRGLPPRDCSLTVEFDEIDEEVLAQLSERRGIRRHWADRVLADAFLAIFTEMLGKLENDKNLNQVLL
jgi:hypothetical protein